MFHPHGPRRSPNTAGHSSRPHGQLRTPSPGPRRSGMSQRPTLPPAALVEVPRNTTIPDDWSTGPHAIRTVGARSPYATAAVPGRSPNRGPWSSPTVDSAPAVGAPFRPSLAKIGSGKRQPKRNDGAAVVGDDTMTDFDEWCGQCDQCCADCCFTCLKIATCQPTKLRRVALLVVLLVIASFFTTSTIAGRAMLKNALGRTTPPPLFENFSAKKKTHKGQFPERPIVVAVVLPGEPGAPPPSSAQLDELLLPCRPASYVQNPRRAGDGRAHAPTRDGINDRTNGVDRHANVDQKVGTEAGGAHGRTRVTITRGDVPFSPQPADLAVVVVYPDTVPPHEPLPKTSPCAVMSLAAQGIDVFARARLASKAGNGSVYFNLATAATKFASTRSWRPPLQMFSASERSLVAKEMIAAAMRATAAANPDAFMMIHQGFIPRRSEVVDSHVSAAHDPPRTLFEWDHTAVKDALPAENENRGVRVGFSPKMSSKATPKSSGKGSLQPQPTKTDRPKEKDDGTVEEEDQHVTQSVSSDRFSFMCEMYAVLKMSGAAAVQPTVVTDPDRLMPTAEPDATSAPPTPTPDVSAKPRPSARYGPPTTATEYRAQLADRAQHHAKEIMHPPTVRFQGSTDLEGAKVRGSDAVLHAGFTLDDGIINEEESAFIVRHKFGRPYDMLLATLDDAERAPVDQDQSAPQQSRSGAPRRPTTPQPHDTQHEAGGHGATVLMNAWLPVDGVDVRCSMIDAGAMALYGPMIHAAIGTEQGAWVPPAELGARVVTAAFAAVRSVWARLPRGSDDDVQSVSFNTPLLRGELDARRKARGDLQSIVLWDTYCDCSGFSAEVVDLVLGLRAHARVRLQCNVQDLCPGYSAVIEDALKRRFVKLTFRWTIARGTDFIHIIHRLPGHYRGRRSTTAALNVKYRIGRSMTETTFVPRAWVRDMMRAVNEVWVPSQWGQDLLLASMPSDRVRVVPEALDVSRFDARTVSPLRLPPKPNGLNLWCNDEFNENDESAVLRRQRYGENFKFFSQFKWELRKGVDVLLESYFKAFTRSDKVTLYIHTGPRFAERPIEGLHRWALENNVNVSNSAHVCLIDRSTLPVSYVARLFAAADAFVLLTRGEGWGLPPMQAMAFGKPTIVTNWGGLTEYARKNHSFLVELDGLAYVRPGDFMFHGAGMKWGQPSVAHATYVLRYVHSHPEHARAVARRGQAYVRRHFDWAAVGQRIADRLKEAERKFNSLTAILTTNNND